MALFEEKIGTAPRYGTVLELCAKLGYPKDREPPKDRRNRQDSLDHRQLHLAAVLCKASLYLGEAVSGLEPSSLEPRFGMLRGTRIQINVYRCVRAFCHRSNNGDSVEIVI